MSHSPLHSVAVLLLAAVTLLAGCANERPMAGPSTNAASASSLVAAARDGAYSAAGLYSPRVTTFDNGLTLIAKHRPGIRTVSVRVSVGLGMAHYRCGRQHTPHFLEHMLFAGVPGMSENAFERRMFELGAWSNAYTGNTDTVYELDVFSGTAMPALDLFADMITNAELGRESFRKTRDIVRRETGGEPGEVERKRFTGGELASGFTEALAELSPRHFQLCGERHAGQDLAFDAVRRAYRDHYGPERMVWTVAGDFDPNALSDWARERLGSLPRGHPPTLQAPTVASFEQDAYSGFGGEPGVTILARTDGITGNDYYARQFLAHLLDERLYARLRLDTALTYTPGAYVDEHPGWGLFGLHAETPAEDHDEALAIMRAIIDELTKKPMPADDFRSIQLSLMRQWAQGVETNSGYADYYIASLPQFRRDGHFLNEELRIAALTPERVHAVARKLFAPERTVVVRDRDLQPRIASRPATEP